MLLKERQSLERGLPHGVDLHSHALEIDEDIAGRGFGRPLGLRGTVIDEFDRLDELGAEEFLKPDGDIKRGPHTALVLADRPAGDPEVRREVAERHPGALPDLPQEVALDLHVEAAR